MTEKEARPEPALTGPQRALQAAGSIIELRRVLGIKSNQAIYQWLRHGHFPRTDWTGETNYARTCAKRWKIPLRELLFIPGGISKYAATRRRAPIKRSQRSGDLAGEGKT